MGQHWQGSDHYTRRNEPTHSTGGAPVSLEHYRAGILHPSLQLKLEDIFKPSINYVELLSEFCVRDLHNQKRSRNSGKEFEAMDDEWILRGAGPKYENFETFVFVKGGIRIFFDDYKVGSYAEGRYEVFVPLDVVAPILEESVAKLWS